MPSRYLPIYLNDHLAGATVGIELAGRLARENDGNELGSTVRELRTELFEDRDTLLRLMRDLGIRPSKVKAGAAWLAEKLGRLKLNGNLVQYSPLSPVVELEGLIAGAVAKHGLWLSLAQIADLDARVRRFDPVALAERATSQVERLEPLRETAAREAFR